MNLKRNFVIAVSGASTISDKQDMLIWDGKNWLCHTTNKKKLCELHIL